MKSTSSPTLLKSSTDEPSSRQTATAFDLRAFANQKRIREKREKQRADASETERRSRSLYGFMQEFWSVLEPTTPFVGGWAVEAICDHLEAVSRGEITRLLINVPPGMSKSLTTGVFFPAWEWGPRGMNSQRYLATSFSGPNVNRDTLKLRQLVESDQYQRIWGHLVRPSSKWGEKKIVNLATGQREGRPFSSMTGGRGDRVVIDDPHSTETAESDVQRANTIRIFREQLTDRLNDVERSAIIVIMQRLHEGDVAGEILKLNDKLEVPYVHLNLPMEFEPTIKRNGVLVPNRCRTYVNGELFFEDPRTEDGELLFPERFPRGSVEDLKTAKGSYAYAGQYQQRPTPRDGGLFKREWFDGKILRELPPIVKSVRSWDFAGSEAKQGTDPDATAGTRMVLAKDGRFIVCHSNRFMESPGKTQTNVVAQAERDGKATEITIPEDPGQAGKHQSSGYIRALAGFIVRAIRPSGSKEVRATPLSIQAEAGNVWLLAGEWVEPWLDEVCAFPNGRYDDQVDASADAFNTLAPAVQADNRHASSGPSKAAQVITGQQQEQLIRQQAQGYGGSGATSVPSRRKGLM